MTLTKPHIAIRHSAYRATISSLKYIIKGVVAAIHIIYIYILDLFLFSLSLILFLKHNFSEASERPLGWRCRSVHFFFGLLRNILD